MAMNIENTVARYIKANAAELAISAATSAETLKHIRIVRGVGQQFSITAATPNITINNSWCGWNDTSSVGLSGRNILATKFAVNSAICEADFFGYIQEQALRSGRELSDGELLDGIAKVLIDGIAKQLDREMWAGSTSATHMSDTFLTIAAADGAQEATAGEVYALALQVASMMPSNALANGKGVIFMSPKNYNVFCLTLATENIYHAPVNIAEGVVIPGTTIKVIPTSGMPDTKIVGGNADNFVFGTNAGTNTGEAFDLFYSRDNQEWRFVSKFTAGVQLVFPDEVVVGTIGG